MTKPTVIRSPAKLAATACAVCLIIGLVYYVASKTLLGIRQLISGEGKTNQSQLEDWALFAEVDRIASIDDVEGALKLARAYPEKKVLHYQLASQLISKQGWNSLVAVVDSLILEEPLSAANILNESIKKGCSADIAQELGRKGFKLNAGQVVELMQYQPYEGPVIAIVVAGCLNPSGLEQYPGGIRKIQVDLRSYRDQVQLIPDAQRATTANILARLAIRADGEQWIWLLEYCDMQERNELLRAALKIGNNSAISLIVAQYNIDTSSFEQAVQSLIVQSIKRDSELTAGNTVSPTKTGALYQLEQLAMQGNFASQFDAIFDQYPEMIDTILQDCNEPLAKHLLKSAKYYAVRSLEKRGAQFDPSWSLDAKYRFFCACTENVELLPPLLREFASEAPLIVKQKYDWGRGPDWILTPLQFAARTSNTRLFQLLSELDPSGLLFGESVLKLLEFCPSSQDDAIRKSILLVAPKYHRGNDESLPQLIAAILPDGLDAMKKIRKRSELPFGSHELPELLNLILATKDLELLDCYLSLSAVENNHPGRWVFGREEERILFDKVLESPELVQRLLLAGLRPTRENFRNAVQQYKPEVIRVLLTDLSLLMEVGRELEDAASTISQNSDLRRFIIEKDRMRRALQANLNIND